MNFKKRLLAALAVIAVSAAMFWIGGRSMNSGEAEEKAVLPTKGKDTLYLWYTDEALTSYLSSAAVTYNENHDVRIVPVLQSAPEYLENINQASLSEESMPDIYLISHDTLEKAYLAGLAEEVNPGEGFSMEELYRETGLKAAAYKDKIIGYPFYFETSALLYNESYLEEMAGEGAVEDMIPATLEDLKTFADSYDAPEQVEAVFKWDVTDVFYNYFFIGSTISMGGESGWDTSQIDIYNEDAIHCMEAYEELNQFFSIDTDTTDYESVIDEFISGKLVFTIATTDVVSRLEQAREDGLFTFDYGIAMTPGIDENTGTRSLSMTNCAVVNGYSRHQQEANDFARFLTSEYNNILYARTGKVSAAKDVDYGYEALDEFAEEYDNSISMPKMIETSNFWVKLEVVFAQVWNGADANDMLKELSEQMLKQVTGEE